MSEQELEIAKKIDVIEKKLDALISALGFDIEVTESVSIPSGQIVIPYSCKLSDRNPAFVPLPVQSEEWSCIVDFVISHREDIINDVNDYGGLGFILDFMERNS